MHLSGGVFARANGSPYYGTKIMDLQNIKYSRYLDATGTHRLRGPEDIARYAALVTGADRMEYGPHRILTPAQQRVRFRYADEILYAIGMYLMSLEPPKNPSPAAPDLIKRGERVFTSQGCVNCHVPPAYTSGKLTLAQGWQPDPNHPNREDVAFTSVGTDPGLALRTRKGTGFYKIPSLRGVWYRPLLLHDGAVASLEELFDPPGSMPITSPRAGIRPESIRELFPAIRSDFDSTPLKKPHCWRFYEVSDCRNTIATAGTSSNPRRRQGGKSWR